MREISPRFLSRALRCLAWSLLVVSADSALGLDPQRGVTQYGLQVWREPEGLPHTSIQAITQTADGYLWLGTDEFWRWRYEAADQNHQRFWMQIAAWIAAPPFLVENDRVSLGTDRLRYQESETAELPRLA